MERGRDVHRLGEPPPDRAGRTGGGPRRGATRRARRTPRGRAHVLAAAQRALVKHLESIPDDRIAELELPFGIPLVYQLGPDLRPDDLGGRYLDPRAAGDGIQAITYWRTTDP